MSIKVNDARKHTFRTMWNLKNKDGWKEFNMIAENKNKQQITLGRHEEAEKRITNLLKQTIGENSQNRQSKKSHQWGDKGPEKGKKRQKGKSKKHANETTQREKNPKINIWIVRLN